MSKKDLDENSNCEKSIWQEQHDLALAEGKDYYVDSKTKMLVFTQNYHLKRGHCCKSGCRHCPYGFVKKS